MSMKHLSVCCLTLLWLLGCGDSNSSPSPRNPNTEDAGVTGPMLDAAPEGDASRPDAPQSTSRGDSGSESAADPDGGELSGFPTECVGEAGSVPESLAVLGCEADFELVAAQPLDSSLPGAMSAKVIVDRVDDNRLYFQNTELYPLHYNFASTHLSAVDDLPVIVDQAAFNENYFGEQRRFYLGAVTYYSGPEKWVFEMAPYDDASLEMITEAYRLVAQATYFGAQLLYHPNGEVAEEQAADLPSSVQVITTDELYEGIDYQPLNLGETVGPIKFIKAAELEDAYVTLRDIVILDSVPNDITPVSGIITEEFQTPLSHINVLARNRGTPNMALRGARLHPKIADLVDGQHVRLVVGAFDFDVIPVSVEESNAWWEDNRPPPVQVPAPDLTVTDLRDIEQVTEHSDEAPYVTVDAIRTATRAFGAKAANYSVFSTDPQIPSKKAFAIPVYYYDQFMRMHGVYDRVEALRQDEEFVGNDAVRDAELAEIRNTIVTGEVDTAFQDLLREKLEQDFPGRSVRFRSSTNAEDLDGFPCAGCYDSHTGDPAKHEGDQLVAALEAIRKTWATVWNLRTYDEREVRSISHSSVAMALLVHTNFPDEEANGVAITNNLFDMSGNTPGFYVNVQEGGEYEVVHPPAGITSDSFLYQYTFPNQPIIYYTHSNIIGEDETVLTKAQIQSLGAALATLNTRFQNAYGAADFSWWALDVEFKFDDEADPDGESRLYIKQARPYPKGGKK